MGESSNEQKTGFAEPNQWSIVCPYCKEENETICPDLKDYNCWYCRRTFYVEYEDANG